MSPRDLTAGLPDLDLDAPCGPNLEFDAAFGELERTAQGKPEQQYGGTIIPGEEPDWKEVAAQADALLDRTRDLRVLVLLALARLQISGAAPFVTVLGAIRYLLDARWAHVHPQLDPEDDNDPTFRANALLPLADPVRVLRPLRVAPLAASRRDGKVSWRSISIFTGLIETDDPSEKKTESAIRAAFNETGWEAVQSTLHVFESGVAELGGIEAAFNSNAGFGNSPDLAPLAKLLKEICGYLRTYMPTQQADAADEAPASDGAAADAVPADAPAPPRSGQGRGGAISATSLTSIASREEAVYLLDLVCRYYQTNEPSSPLPLLVARARGLADKGFLEILQELAPDGLQQAQIIVQSRDG
jgi:type VI secretion system protein ImpA